MTDFADYATKYQCLKMERDGGILQRTLHTEGGPFQWGLAPHEELPRAFADIGADRQNRVVVLTGRVRPFWLPRLPTPTSISPSRPRPASGMRRCGRAGGS